MIDKKCEEELLEEAIKAREFSYSPYSNFKVGAVVKTKSGKIYSGCNIENSSFSPTICAERVAIFKAISEGELEFDAIAIVCNSTQNFCFPCGVCRQVMNEFFDENTIIITGNLKKEYKKFKLKELLPYAFIKKNLIK